MDDSEWWLSGADLHGMALYVMLCHRQRQRKLRLFLVACCHRLRRWIPGRLVPAAVQVAERFADGAATTADLQAAMEGVERRCRRLRGSSRAASIVVAFACPPVIDEYGLARSMRAVCEAERGVPSAAPVPEHRALAALLHEVFGDPFRPVTPDPSWRTPDVLALAQATYQERALPAGTLEPARLLLLADALEDAGCTKAEILDHLRSDGPHVRGCWAVDVCLGKE
jgi:hypothetical protein